jgi:alpha-2-macroglobulin
MLASVRAGFAAALVALLVSLVPAFAADKPFQRADLADSAIRLEAQIKTEAGQVAKPVATLRSEADAAFLRRDFRAGMQTLAMVVAVAPREAGNWLRLSRAILQIRPNDDRERVNFLERAATAAYIAYQRSGNAGEEADALALLGRTFVERKLWRPALDAYRLSLDLREIADIRQTYESLRDEHGFRILDYSVDADAASPRACFQFSEDLPGKRTDFTPFVALEGNDKPAITTEEKQLCVEGLHHGERYSITLRAGLPSTVKETLQKSADYTIYVRDRSPFVHFTGKAYVLPRTGQRGIPIVSVNTSSVKVQVLRVGDRSLIDTVLGSDFQRALYTYDRDRIAQEKGALVWKGDMKIDSVLNADVTTAFPVDQAIGDLKPGVYVMTAEPEGTRREDDYGQLSTQWFIVSDLGLTAFSGNDGVNVFLNSLATTEAKAGIEVRLIARNNEVLASRTTDAAGFVRFESGLARGEGGLSPAMIVADGKGDYAFLSLKGPAFDLTDRGVAGRSVTAALDAFLYTERGVYRSGETVHLTTLLRDSKGVAVPNVPVTLVVDRPDGVEYRRTIVPDQGVGSRALSFPMISSAPTGTYRVRAYTDPKGAAVGSTSFLVEDYVPDRMEFDLASPTGKLSQAQPADVTVDGRFLYGAPASDLALEGEVKVKAAAGRPGFAGYQFGVNDDEQEIKTEQTTLENLPNTDENGKAKFQVSLDKLPETTRPLEAQITVRLVESGGRAVERNLTLPIVPASTMIGVKPLFSGRSLGDGENAGFDVVVAAPDGKQLPASGLRYELLRVERRYQYYRRDGRWDYEPVKSVRRIADGRLDVASDKPGRISLPVSYGRYRLDVSSDDKSIPATSLTFDAGFYSDASADTPDLLEIALDKSAYAGGDTMTVAVTARTAGKVTLNVVGDRLLSTTTTDVQAGTAKIALKVGDDWGSGAYVVATLRRPLDEAASRMPGRAIGLQWFSVDKAARTLSFEMPLPSLMRPNGTLRVPVRLKGLSAGEEAKITVAAVDVGILNLTNYKPPAPDDFYLGQRRLASEVRDLYGQLLDGMQGARGQIRSGGDTGAAALAAAPPTQPPLALFSGIVSVKPDGSAEVTFDIPAFSGTVRVMAVAWSKDKVGHASGDVVVRDPVVLTATLPRFLLTGDQGTIRLDLDNVDGPAGEYAISLVTDGPLNVPQKEQKIRLNGKQRAGVALPISATSVGIGNVAIRVSGPNGFDMQRAYTLAAKPATQVLTRRTVRPIARGESITLSNDLFADLVPGTGGVQLSVGPSTALDVAALLKALDRYPYGCSEQTTSRALPLLYVNELSSESHLALDSAIDDRIKGAIERLLSRQGANGSFGLWGPGGGDMWLDAYVTDFLTRARERNFAIPDIAFRQALDNLRNHVAQSDPTKEVNSDLAYVYYVLARNGAAPLGDLRYLADTRLDALKTPIAKAQLAAALGMLGDKTRAERVYNAALADISPTPKLELGRTDYGSSLRDASAFVALASEGNAPRATILKAVERIEAARNLSPYTSTQENAWMVLAARALVRDTANMVLDVSGETKRGALYRSFRPAELAGGPIRVTNNGDAAVQAVVSVVGAPVTPEPAAEKGFRIERLYYTLDGEPADVTKVKQNERFVVVLKITEGQPTFGRIIIADYLPAGFEIDNPRLVSSGDTGALSWIEDAKDPENSEFRDDRFTAAFSRSASDKAVFTVAYVVRAVSPGKYVLPQAYVEDMYRPDRFGRTGVGSVEIEAAK